MQYDPLGIMKMTINQMYHRMEREPIERMSVRNYVFGEKLNLYKYISTFVPSMKYDRYGLLTRVSSRKLILL